MKPSVHVKWHIHIRSALPEHATLPSSPRCAHMRVRICPSVVTFHGASIQLGLIWADRPRPRRSHSPPVLLLRHNVVAS